MVNENTADNRTVTELLDDGAEALRFFELFEPLYIEWVGGKKAGVKSHAQLHALYYQQNGLNEDKFRYAAEAVQEVLVAAEDQHGKLRQYAQNLPSMWSGDAATKALTMVTQQLTYAENDIAVVKKVHGELADSVTVLRAAAGHKAALVESILINGLVKVLEENGDGGKPPEDVKTIIEGANHVGLTHLYPGSIVNEISRILPDWDRSIEADIGYVISGITLGAVVPMTPLANQLEDYCREWMGKFTTEYERLVDVFVKACEETDRLVQLEYDAIVAAFDGLTEESYPCPQGPQQAAPPQTTTTTTTTGNPSTPGTTPTTPSTSTTTTPSTTTPGDNPLSVLTQLGTQLASSGIGTQLTQGLSQLVSSAAEQVGSTLEQLREQAENPIDTDGDGEPDKPEDAPDGAENQGEEGENGNAVQLNGREYKLELGPDGRLQLVVTGAEGEPQAYRVEIGADGKPMIVDANADGNNQAPETADAGDGQPSAGQPGGTPGVQSGKKGEDGEHQPQYYPPQPEVGQEQEPQPEPSQPGEGPPPSPPVDTGAQLAEAGPL